MTFYKVLDLYVDSYAIKNYFVLMEIEAFS